MLRVSTLAAATLAVLLSSPVYADDVLHIYPDPGDLTFFGPDGQQYKVVRVQPHFEGYLGSFFSPHEQTSPRCGKVLALLSNGRAIQTLGCWGKDLRRVTISSI